MTLIAAINALTDPSPHFNGDNIAAAASGAAFWAANLDLRLALNPHADKDNHTICLFNIGVNDFGNVAEAAWIANVETVADSLRGRWPALLFYIMRPWKRNFDAMADTFAGWIAQIVASRSFCKLGPDERLWLKGADDGATMTVDGVHYSAAGEAECAAQWLTVLGF